MESHHRGVASSDDTKAGRATPVIGAVPNHSLIHLLALALSDGFQFSCAGYQLTPGAKRRPLGTSVSAAMGCQVGGDQRSNMVPPWSDHSWVA